MHFSLESEAFNKMGKNFQFTTTNDDTAMIDTTTLLFLLYTSPLAIILLLFSFYIYFSLVRHGLVVQHVKIEVDTKCNNTTINSNRNHANDKTESRPCDDIVIAHLSDFHYDFGLEPRMDAILEEAVQILDNMFTQQEQKLDLILLTGDYVNHDPKPIERFCQTFVKKIHGKASLGILASLGNHDNYGDETDVPTPFKNSMEYITQCLTDAGVTVLRNKLVEVSDGIWICGLEDIWNPAGWRGHKGVMKELHQKDDAILRLVMSHNPDSAEQLKDYHHDLQLAGHTHGGQICLPSVIKIPGYTYNVPVLALLRPVFDWAIPRLPKVARTALENMRRRRKYSYVVNNWRWSQGLHDVTDTSGGPNSSHRKQLYVSRGIGTHRNMRLFCPPELAILNITCKQGRSSSHEQSQPNKKMQ